MARTHSHRQCDPNWQQLIKIPVTYSGGAARNVSSIKSTYNTRWEKGARNNSAHRSRADTVTSQRSENSGSQKSELVTERQYWEWELSLNMEKGLEFKGPIFCPIFQTLWFMTETSEAASHNYIILLPTEVLTTRKDAYCWKCLINSWQDGVIRAEWQWRWVTSTYYAGT